MKKEIFVYGNKEYESRNMNLDLSMAIDKLIEYLDTIFYSSRFKNEDRFQAYLENIYVNLLNYK